MGLRLFGRPGSREVDRVGGEEAPRRRSAAGVHVVFGLWAFALMAAKPQYTVLNERSAFVAAGPGAEKEREARAAAYTGYAALESVAFCNPGTRGSC